MLSVAPEWCTDHGRGSHARDGSMDQSGEAEECLGLCLLSVTLEWGTDHGRGSDGSMDQSGEAEEYPGSGCVLSVDAHVSGLWPG